MRGINKLHLFQSIVLKLSSAVSKFMLVKVMLMYVNIDMYGRYTYSMAIFMFVMMLSRFGLDVFLQKQVSSKNLTGETAVGQALTISIVSMFFSLVLYLIFYHSDYSIFWLFFIFASFFYSSSWIFNYILKGKGYIKESIAIYELLFPFVNIIAIFIFNQYFEGAVVLLLSFVSSLILVFMVMMWFFFNKKVIKDVRLVKPELTESYVFSLIAISTMLLVLGDTYLIGFLLEDFDVGIYALTTKIGMFVLLPVSVVSTFLNNKVAQNIGDSLKIRALIAPSLFLNTVIVVLFSGLIYLGSPLILNFLGVEVSSVEKIIHLLIVYLVAQAIMGAFGVFESILIMGGGQKSLFQINLIMISVNFILGYLFITEWGLIGAVYSTLISCIVCRCLQIKMVYQKVL